nr:folylpolyglutamate synthase/dihydrofolate synthase family protein [Paludibacter sp. 221]
MPVFHHIGKDAYKPGLENTTSLLNALHNPQTKYKTVHIAGTNGKGSVSHMLSAVLQKAGYTTGLYTSPHLVDFRERIRINGEKIPEQYVVNFVEKHESLFEKIQPSFFEATMTMAFAYFADKEVDVAIVETGLGGRLDSTNIIQPELSVITNISFDHTQLLGDTLEKIAAEKAGIIKHATPVVIGESQPATRPVFRRKAKEMDAPILFADELLAIRSGKTESGKLQVTTSDNRRFRVGLTGNYQLKNVVTTLVAIGQLQKQGFHISAANIEDGLADVNKITGLQGRWQIVSDSPKIVLDTGHNVAGISWVAEQLKAEQYNTLRIVVGMVNDKDITAVLSLLPRNAVYYFTQADIARALPADDLQRQASVFGLRGGSFSSVKMAVEQAISESSPADMVFVGGSNFVVGEALPYFR